jgi:hypothetical protein
VQYDARSADRWEQPLAKRRIRGQGLPVRLGDVRVIASKQSHSSGGLRVLQPREVFGEHPTAAAFDSHLLQLVADALEEPLRMSE